MYIHEHTGWPNFTWNQSKLASLLPEVSFQQGYLWGKASTLPLKLREEANLMILTQDVLCSSAIEGEIYPIEQVRSTLARYLGMEIETDCIPHSSARGMIEIVLDASVNHHLPLTSERLSSWHTALFSDVNDSSFTAGQWRTNKSISKYSPEKFHFEVPGHEHLPYEMQRFLKWFNAPSKTPPEIKSALAHFWFMMIYPFDEGNGLIARTIADMLLSRYKKNRQRFYSMSSQFLRERDTYYNLLAHCDGYSLDITPWIEWYVNCLRRAITASSEALKTIFTKGRFWRTHSEQSFNFRQQTIIEFLLDEVGRKLNTSKWSKLTQCSQDTALRDITDLLQRKILIKDKAGGRSTSYQLNLPGE